MTGCWTSSLAPLDSRWARVYSCFLGEKEGRNLNRLEGREEQTPAEIGVESSGDFSGERKSLNVGCVVEINELTSQEYGHVSLGQSSAVKGLISPVE
ncbi:hypothetical protein TNCV_4880181 [Trichonephila clavipes]|nr:hypothetical protein TNCV_4880181 [Trichonephila clavipes]